MPCLFFVIFSASNIYTTVSDSLVIIPTYNEKENIERMINTVFSLPKDFHILVVDDGSPDGTAAIVKKLQHKFSDRLFIEERAAKSGLGTAYIHGFKWGIAKGGSLYTRMITWMPIKDPTAGFMCYRKEVLETINLDEIAFVGYAFQIEMKFAAWKLGFKIVEVPIIFQDRTHGTSKMNKGIVKEGILGVLKLRWDSFFKSYRKKLRNNNELTAITVK